MGGDLGRPDTDKACLDLCSEKPRCKFVSRNQKNRMCTSFSACASTQNVAEYSTWERTKGTQPSPRPSPRPSTTPLPRPSPESESQLPASGCKVKPDFSTRENTQTTASNSPGCKSKIFKYGDTCKLQCRKERKFEGPGVYITCL